MQSHPGKELKEHLENVKTFGMNIFHTKDTIWQKNKRIERALEIILETHDYGKGTKYFQEYIIDTSNEKYQKSPYNMLKKHGELGALWCYYRIMKEIDDLKLAFIGYMIVRKHHGNIIDFEKEIFLTSDIDVLNKILDKFNYEYFKLNDEKEQFLEDIKKLSKGKLGFKFSKEIRKIIEKFELSDYVLCNYLFSILITADKGEAIFFSSGRDFQELMDIKNKKSELDYLCVDKYKSNKFGKAKNKVDETREAIYQEVENNILSEAQKGNKIFSINVPTGTGKTLTSINGALKLKNKLENKHKIIYTLPFTSVIDQNFNVFSEVIGESSKDSNILLKHHYLADKKYKTSEDEMDFSESEYFIENWDSSVVVTTFVQLLNSLLTNKNRKLKKFHNIADSIIILDEVQSIPHKYWLLVNRLLKTLTETMNCYIILVTATMPLIFKEKYGEIVELAKNKEEYFKFFNRIELDISNLSEYMTLEEFQEFSANEVENNIDDSFLFVLNTVKSSLKTYENLKNEFPEKTIIYLSTNIIPKERLERIQKIKETQGVIVVATQMIEAGVDIDIDRVYRDFGPLDSINQVCGRCNRNGIKAQKGIVKLVKILDENNKDKPFFEYVYREQILAEATKGVFNSQNEIIPEKDFYKLANQYFENIDNSKSDDNSDVILEWIEKLKYKQAFESREETRDKQFRLISQSFKTVDLFIMLDDRAKELWEQSRKIYSTELNKYKRKELFSEIKSDFLSYVISVPEKFYSEGTEGFNLIDKESLKTYYDEDTGFKREDKQEDFFI